MTRARSLLLCLLLVSADAVAQQAPASRCIEPLYARMMLREMYLQKHFPAEVGAAARDRIEDALGAAAADRAFTLLADLRRCDRRDSSRCSPSSRGMTHAQVMHAFWDLIEAAKPRLNTSQADHMLGLAQISHEDWMCDRDSAFPD